MNSLFNTLLWQRKRFFSCLILSLLWVMPPALAQDQLWLRLNQLGMRALSQGQLHYAEQTLMQSLQHARTLTNVDKEIAASLNNLGMVYHQQGRFDLAEQSLREALALRRTSYGERHRLVGQSFNNLARTLQANANYAASERMYTIAIDIYRELFGSRHPLVADTMSNLGSLYQATHRYDRAQAVLLQSYAIKKETLGADHPKVAITVGNLAGIAVYRGDVISAEKLYKQVISIHQKRQPPRYASIVIAMNNLTALYRTRCRDEEVKILANKALDLIEQHLGGNHTLRGSLLLRLASSELMLDETAAARRHFQQAYDFEKKLFGAAHPSLVPILEAQATLLRKESLYSQAKALEKEAMQIRQDHNVSTSSAIIASACGNDVV